MKVMLSVALLFALLLPLSGHAQLAGHNTKGDFGLQSGTQAPPGFYIVPLYYDFSADTLRDGNGDSFEPLGGGGSVDAGAFIVGGLWVTDNGSSSKTGGPDCIFCSEPPEMLYTSGRLVIERLGKK